MHQKFPHLISFSKNANITVFEAVHAEYIEDMFHLPLSYEAYSELTLMEANCLKARQDMETREDDEWSYIWGSNKYSSQKAYKFMIGHQPTPPHFGWIWKSSCQSKHKFFFWLLLRDRLNTRNLLARKNFQLQSLLCFNNDSLQHLTRRCSLIQISCRRHML